MYNLNETIYHYCSLETFYNIISSRTLRLVNVKFFRDRNEQKHLLKYLENSLRPRTTHAAYRLKKAIKLAADSQPEAFALCCSLKPNLLSQWRAYADDGAGVSIGINPKFLNEFRDLLSNPIYQFFETFLSKMIYVNSQKKELLKQLLNAAEVYEGGESGVQLEENEYHIEAEQYLALLLKSYSPLCKHTDFEHEEEARFLYIRNPYTNSAVFQNERGSRIMADNVHYGHLRGRIVSYYEIDISENIKSTPKAIPFINDIWLGPRCKAKKQEIKEFLDAYNMLGPDSTINISDTTYE